MTRIVIGKDRTFVHDGRTFRIGGTYGGDPANPGYGYHVEDIRTGQDPGEGYETLAAVRRRAAADIDAWRQGHTISGYAGTGQARCSCGWEATAATPSGLDAVIDGHHPEARWGP